MVKLNVNPSKITGKIKAMNGVGQPPIEGISCRHLHFLKEAFIPYSRLHDVGGAFGGNIFVDIPNIFRDFSADENDPASYDFKFTDILINGLIEVDCMPIFRLGVSIENYHYIQAYRIFPPDNYEKWARICAQIIRHYCEGWADGFHHNIVYWEIWNEPDFEPLPEKNQMWLGTAEEFYTLYSITATYLKRCFGNSIKVGGYGSCGFYGIFADPKKYAIDADPRNDAWTTDISHVYHIDFFHGFLRHLQKTNAPLDFFSWHTYCTVQDAELIADYIDQVLIQYGFGNVETMLNEWNPTPGKALLGSTEACANAAAMMCAMQNKKTDILCYYDARMRAGAFGGLFNAITEQPYSTYYAFMAFGEMRMLEHQLECSLEGEMPGLYAVASGNCKNRIIMIVNISGEDAELATNLDPTMSVYLIDNNHLYTKSKYKADGFVLRANQVAVIKDV